MNRHSGSTHGDDAWISEEPDAPRRRRRRKGGPKTEEGKKRSSLNAVKHGLTAASPHGLAFVEQQVAVELQPILDRVLSYYEPWDPIEEELCLRIARCLWRLHRAARMEARMLERFSALSKPGPSHESIIRYERMVDLQMHRAIRALDRKRGRK